MPIRVLGCSGSIAAGSRTTAFLLDDDVLIDAGTGVGDLALDELARIDHIVISHSHLDHVLAIGLLADSVLRLRLSRGRPPIQVHALEATVQALKTHVFNGVIWPDFTALPDRERPVLRFVPFAVGDRLTLGGRVIEVLPASRHGAGGRFRRLARGGGRRRRPWVFTGVRPARMLRCGNAVRTIEIGHRRDRDRLP